MSGHLSVTDTAVTVVRVQVDSAIERVDLTVRTLWQALALAIDCQYIESVRTILYPLGQYLMVVDESGLYTSKGVNKIASRLYAGQPGDFIKGDVLILKERYGDEGPDLYSLTEEEVAHVLRILTWCSDHLDELTWESTQRSLWNVVSRIESAVSG